VEWLLLFLVGLVAGTVGTIVGLGGGIITVPALMFLAGADPRFHHITAPVAVGTSLALIILTALSSTLSYARQRRVDFASGWLFFVACGPGTVIGAYLTHFFHSGGFLVGFGLLMLGVSGILSFRDKLKGISLPQSVTRTFVDSEGREYTYGYHRPTAIAISFVVGLISGMFGIGGGSYLVPMMVMLFRFPPHVATATSMFVILLSSVIGSVTHAVQGNIDWLAALWIAPGAWIGGQLGAAISARMSSRALLVAFRIAVVLVAVKLITDGMSSWS
jgi:uncharacterized membrane protein YfcA